MPEDDITVATVLARACRLRSRGNSLTILSRHRTDELFEAPSARAVASDALSVSPQETTYPVSPTSSGSAPRFVTMGMHPVSIDSAIALPDTSWADICTWTFDRCIQ